jgi:putative membrane protein
VDRGDPTEACDGCASSKPAGLPVLVRGRGDGSRATVPSGRSQWQAGSAMMGAAMGWMWVWPVLVTVGLAILGYLGVRLVQGRQGTSPAGSDPSGLDPRWILDQRYARGEIDDEEYRRRRDMLP